jgi:hypothetical protein
MRTVKPNTAKHYLSAIRSFHIENGIPISVFSDPRIDLVIRGGRRLYGDGTRKLRLPLTAPILIRILSEIRNDEDGINLKSALCVAFAAFLRSGEFTWSSWSGKHYQSHLSRCHVIFKKDSVVLTLPASKTDPFRHGADIHLASSPSSPLCPVAALQTLFQRHPRPPTDPLFSRAYNHPFTKLHLINSIHELLLQAGLSTFGFTGHSIRKGAAVTAAMNGISKDNIKLLGRWKSDAVDIYINEISHSDHAKKLLLLNSQLTRISSPQLSGAVEFRGLQCLPMSPTSS